MKFRRYYLRLVRTILHLLYPAKVKTLGHLSEDRIVERVLLKKKHSVRLPDDGNGAQDVPLNKKEIRVLSNVTFWPSLSIVQINQNTLDVESEIENERLQALLSRKHARAYPTAKMEGYITSIDCAPGWRNYYHWFCESVPRIWSLYHSNLKKYGNITLLTSRNFKKEEQKILQALLPSNVTLKKVPNRLRIQSDYIDLPILTETGLALLPDDYLAFYRDTVFSCLDIPVPQITDRKIYISRKNTKRRRFINEDEVATFLTQRGYETHTMDGLSIRDQAALFASASHIVSPHGAALTNLLYSPKDLQILEIHHSKEDPRLDAYYRGLAFSLGMHYESIWLDAPNKNEDIVLPIHVLEEALCEQVAN